MKDIADMTTDEFREMIELTIPHLSLAVEKNMRQIEGLIERGEVYIIHSVKDIAIFNMQFLIMCLMARITEKHCKE